MVVCCESTGLLVIKSKNTNTFICCLFCVWFFYIVKPNDSSVSGNSSAAININNYNNKPLGKGNCISIHGIYVYICNIPYKWMQYLMIRDYYLKGPTVRVLFVIAITLMVMNSFVLMWVLCRLPLKLYIN